MRVQIIKARKASYWYADMVGDIMEVLDEPEQMYGEVNYVVKSCRSKYLAIEDVVKVTTHYVMISPMYSRGLTSKKYRKALEEALAYLGWRVEEVVDHNGKITD